MQSLGELWGINRVNVTIIIPYLGRLICTPKECEVSSGTVKVAQLCLPLCDPVDCSLPGSSVHGIFQVRILERIAISSSTGSSRARGGTRVSSIGRRILYHCAT